MKELYKGNRSFEDSVITPRGFEEVRDGLALPMSEVRSDMMVLSIGEGLSDFARTLCEKTGAKVVAVDPVYNVIHPSDGLREASDKLQKRGMRPVEIYQQVCSIAPPLPRGERPRAVAATIYELPIGDRSVDLIVANRLLEHIDIGKALPELLRVLKQDGEIRFGTTRLHLTRIDDKTFACPFGLYERDEGMQFTLSRVLLGTDDFFAYLKKHKTVHCYEVVTGLWKQHIFEGTTLIFRKDRKTPSMNPFNTGAFMVEVDATENVYGGKRAVRIQ